MIIFESIPTMLLLCIAAAMTVWGSVMQKNHVPAFFGGVFASAAVLCALVYGARLQECLVYVLVLLLLSTIGRKEGRT